MGAACSSPEDMAEEKYLEREKDQRLMDALNTHHEKHKSTVRILLLGAGECGKSTILKQVMYIFALRRIWYIYSIQNIRTDEDPSQGRLHQRSSYNSHFKNTRTPRSSLNITPTGKGRANRDHPKQHDRFDEAVDIRMPRLTDDFLKIDNDVSLDDELTMELNGV
eukprot:63942-Amorphochlora_amoeboformis.AAC.1